MVRKHIYFSGDVQGVGFRYRSCYIAQSLGLTGWVENLWDGRVEMEVQGDENSIQQMLVQIQKQRDRGEPYGNHGDSVRGGEGIPDTVESGAVA